MEHYEMRTLIVRLMVLKLYSLKIYLQNTYNLFILFLNIESKYSRVLSWKYVG